MKWLYIAVGLFFALIVISMLSSGNMYTSKGDTVLPIHIGVDNGQ